VPPAGPTVGGAQPISQLAAAMISDHRATLTALMNSIA
jgi:hypothetical protein